MFFRRATSRMWIAFTSLWLSLGLTIFIWDWSKHGLASTYLYDLAILLGVPALSLGMLWICVKVGGWMSGGLGRAK